MKANFPLLLPACLALAACTANTPKPAPAPPLPPPVVKVITLPAPPDEIGPLLNYHQSLRRMSQGELLKELSGLGLQQRSPRVALEMGMALMLTRGAGDLARAQALFDGVATSADAETAPLRPLAQLLSSNCAETRRVSEHADKLAVQQKESQRRIDQLNETLEALKTIERTLPVRPTPAAAPAPTPQVNK